ncbi:hypothetical protein BC830DRAFT_1149357 [Chytriomyces sp. MP71]|nr:hypothetical protein BC830DRAFT_1149357 [Chytriomyces sp. MP71]
MYGQTRVSVRENHIGRVRDACIIERSGEGILLVATVSGSQTNVYDSNYCEEGALDLVCQLDLVDGHQSEDEDDACACVALAETDHELLLLLGTRSGRIRIASLSQAREISAFCLGKGPLSRIHVSPARMTFPLLILVSAGSALPRASLWLLHEDNASPVEATAFPGDALNACFTLDGHSLLYTDSSFALCRITVLGDTIHHLTISNNFCSRIVAIQPAGPDTAIAITEDGTLLLADLTARQMHALARISRKHANLDILAIHPAGCLVCVGSAVPACVDVYRLDAAQRSLTLLSGEPVKVRHAMKVLACRFSTRFLFCVGGGGLVVRIPVAELEGLEGRSGMKDVE